MRGVESTFWVPKFSQVLASVYRRFNEVHQVNKTQQTADIDGWSRPRGGRPARVEGAVGSVIAVGVDRGVVLDPVKARRRQKKIIWCSLPYSPQTRLLESIGIRK
jgi:hypothetical protein